MLRHALGREGRWEVGGGKGRKIPRMNFFWQLFPGCLSPVNRCRQTIKEEAEKAEKALMSVFPASSERKEKPFLPSTAGRALG